MGKASTYFLKISILLFILLVLTVASIWWANKYVQSEGFISKITEYTKDIDGLEITHLSKITINSYFPLFEFEIPKVSLKYQGDNSEYKIHVDKTIIKANFDFIKSTGKRGKLKLSTQSVRVTEKFSNSNSDSQVSDFYKLISGILFNRHNIEFGFTSENCKYLSVNLDTTDSTDYSLNNVLLGYKDKKAQLHYEFKKSKLQHIHLFNELTSHHYAVSTKYSFLEKNNSAQIIKRINSEISITAENLTLSELEVTFPDHKLIGNLIITQAKKPLLKGKLFYEPKDMAHYKSTKEKNGYDFEHRLFSNDKLPIEILKEFETDIDLLVPGIFYNGNKLFSGKFNLISANNLVQINSEKSKLLNGPIKISLSLDHSNESPRLEISIKGFDHLITTIGLRQNNKDLFGSGSFNVFVNLKLAGISIAEMFANSSGFIGISSNSILIKDYLDHAFFATGLSFLATSNSQNNNSVNHEITNGRRGDDSIVSDNKIKLEVNSINTNNSDLLIPCLSGSFYITDGYLVADDGILLDSGNGMLIGTGIIDFHNEKIFFENRVQKNSPIYITPLSILRYLSISGTLANPNVNINKVAIQKGISAAVSSTLGTIPSLALSAIQEMNKTKEDKLTCNYELYK